MSRTRTRTHATVAAAAALAAAVVVVAPSAAAPAPVKLVGTVGPGFTITLTQGGKPVKQLRAGPAVITVSDKASFHNFELEQQSGGKLALQLTTVPFTGTKTVKLTLTRGTYKFYCAPHESSMFGTFTVA
jgi:plastocyanin